MLKQLLEGSRYLVLAAVVGALVAATALLIYGLVDSFVVIVRALTAGDFSTAGAKAMMYYFIELFDLFLLGTVMLIMAISLYALFIDADLKIPTRLQIHTFEDLKVNLMTVVILVMAVTFLGMVMSWDGKADLLGVGVGVALVIAALNVFLWIARSGKN